MPAANEDIHGDINRASAPGVSPIVPGDLNAVPLIIKELSSLGGAPDVSKIDDSQRLELISKTKSLLLALETPRETMIRHCWGQVRCYPCLWVTYNVLTVFVACRICCPDYWRAEGRLEPSRRT